MITFYKTISKNRHFVISLLFLCFTASGCSSLPFGEQETTAEKPKELSDIFGKPRVVGRINSPKITESSGLVASRCNENIFWTHNDSGNGSFIFALNEKGRHVGTWRVKGAKSGDWEDIATAKDKNGECILFVGDIGNNSMLRNELTVYRFREPTIKGKNASSKISQTKAARAIKYTYPDRRRNAEALLVHPKSGEIYVLTKSVGAGSVVYKFSARGGRATKVAQIDLPAFPTGLVTGGDISSDGRRVVLTDYYNAYEYSLRDRGASFDSIWTSEPTIIEVGERDQGEAVCYSPDMTAVYTTSEKRGSPFIKIERE